MLLSWPAALQLSVPGPGQHVGLYTGPYFSGISDPRILNLTVMVGQTVHLPCRVKQVGTNTVSWVRNTDSSILSIDKDKIVQDKRFKIVQSEDRNDWILIIKNVAPGDAGSYECQISTENKMSRFVQLKVIVPAVKIDGAPDIFAKSGSSVDIICTVTDVKTSSLIWYKDGEVLPLSMWEDVSVKMTEKIDSVVSTLTINNISHQRLGIYSCRPDGLALHNVTLHVIDAKEQGLRTNNAVAYKGFISIISIFSVFVNS